MKLRLVALALATLFIVPVGRKRTGGRKGTG